MIFHELATNSLKHGALSMPTGVIDITSTSGDEKLVIVWAETGGPVIAGTPVRNGFGSRIVLQSVERQRRGTFDVDWQPAGLVATLSVPRLQLAK